MATYDIHLCSLCKEDNVNNEAVTWCTECDTFLCLDCDKHHSRNKSSKQHKTLPSNDYKKLPDFIIKTGNRCLDHDQRYELYCPNHSAACCLQCFTEKHQNCKHLKRLPDILKDVKSSASMTCLEKDLSDAKAHFITIGTFLRGRFSKMQKQKTSGIEEIHLIRKSLNEHLDRLEQRILKELDIQHTKLKTKTEKLINQIETKHSYMKRLQEDNEKMKNYATEFQTFIGLQEIAKSTIKEVGYLQELTQSGDLDELSIEVKISSDMKYALQKLTCYGSVSVSSVQCSLELKKEVECQVPISIPTVKTINDISPVLRQKITFPNNDMKYNITGCQILPNGNLLFVDSDTKQLIQCNNKGNYIEKVITFKSKPLYICYVKDNTVAVTLPWSHQILKIDLVNREIITTIRRGNNIWCYGIDSNGEAFVVAEWLVSKRYVTVLDLEGTEIRCIKMDSFWECVVMSENKLYCTNLNTNTLLCMEDNGKKLWEIDNKEFDQPTGIAIDNNKFIYVVCANNNSIIITSPEGVTSRILMSDDDGINTSVSICVDRKTQTLLVSNRYDGSAFVFQI